VNGEKKGGTRIILGGTEEERKKILTLRRARGEEERIIIDGERKRARKYVFLYAFTPVPCILRFFTVHSFQKLIHALQPIHGSP